MDGDRRDPPRRDVREVNERQSPDEDRRDVARDARRRNLGSLIDGFVAAILVAGGVLFWLHARHDESTDDAFGDGNTTQMAPQVAGRVTALRFTDNQPVTAGQKLVLIDPRDFQLRLDQVEARQANAAAQLAQANAKVAVRQADLDRAQANVRVAEAQQVQAHRDYDRHTSISRSIWKSMRFPRPTSTATSTVFRLARARPSACYPPRMRPATL